MEKIRVLQMVGSLGNAGLETVIMNYYRNINRNKIQFDFVVSSLVKQKYDDEIEKMGGKIFRLPSRNKHPIKYMKSLAKILKENNYKIFHCNTNSASCTVDLAVAKFCNIPIRIAHSHNSSCVKKVQHYLLKPFLNFVVTDRFACSKIAADWVFGKRKYNLINNAIDVSKFKFEQKTREKIRKQLNIDNEDKVIGVVGRLSNQKNPLFMLEVFNELIKRNFKCKLLMIGSGELKNDVEKRAKELKITENIIFTGNINNVNEYYSAMDIFCMPSLYEGLSVALIEAQTNGLKCIISENITKEAIITDNVSILPIDKGTRIWTDMIIETLIKNYTDHSDVIFQIVNNGYDIITESNKLEQFYLEKINICEEKDEKNTYFSQ